MWNPESLSLQVTCTTVSSVTGVEALSLIWAGPLHVKADGEDVSFEMNLNSN